MKARTLFPGPFTVLLSVFGSMKNDLTTVRYSNDDEEKNARLRNQVGQNLFDTRNETLVQRRERVPNKLDDRKMVRFSN